MWFRKAPLILIPICLTIYVQAQSCLPIDSAFQRSSLRGCLLAFTDSTNSRNVSDLDLNRFYPVQRPNFGTDGLAHWLTFTCENTTANPKHLVVEVDIVYADEMSFYVLADSKVIQKIEHDSWRVPIWKRTIQSRYFAFPLDIQPHQHVRVYIHGQEHSGTLLMPVTVWDKAAFETYALTQTIAFATPAATLLILALASLVLFLFFPNVIWIFYAVHAVGTAIYTLNIEGFMAHYAPAPLNQIKGYAIGVSTSWIANLLFTQHFVYKRLTKPVNWIVAINYGVVAVQSIWLLYLLIMPFKGNSASVALWMTGLTASFIFCCLLICLGRGSREARFYLVAITPFLLSILIRVLASANVITTQSWHYYARYYTPLFEIIVLGVGAIRQLIRERETTLIQLDNAQKEIISAQETERRRLAQDLHDDIGTSLIALRGKLPADSPDAQHLLDQIITDVRAVSHNLMPDELATLGLTVAVAEAARRLQEASHIRLFFVSAGEVVALSQAAELAAYRAVLELLHNVVRHSKATEAVVQLVYHPDGLNITIEDNGQGFPIKKGDKPGGIGLKSVASRTEWLGGKMAIDSSGAGTTIRLDIPYESRTS